MHNNKNIKTKTRVSNININQRIWVIDTSINRVNRTNACQKFVAEKSKHRQAQQSKDLALVFWRWEMHFIPHNLRELVS